MLVMRLLRYLFSLFVFWMVFFAIHRTFFVFYQLPIGDRIQHRSEILKAFVAGYRLDFATAAIFSLLPMLLAVLYFFSNKIVWYNSLRFLILILSVIYSAGAIADAGLYHEWSAKLNMQALSHFKNPAEVIQTVPWYLSVLFIVLVAVFTIPFYIFYTRIIHPQIQGTKSYGLIKSAIAGVLTFIFLIALFIIIIRGGITNIPINQSVAFFSKDALANDIAINPLYNVLQDATIVDKIPNASTYKQRSNDDAFNLIRNDFLTSNDSVESILTTTKPNIVFIILESWSTDNISVLGGIEGCTPRFNALCSQGLLCTKTYSNGYVTDQGIPAMLSAAPSAPRYAIINQNNNLAAIPCISEDLTRIGYHSGFMFGGDLVYGGLKAYLMLKQFQTIQDVNDWPQYPKGQLGIHDEFMFPELINTLDHAQEPFLQCFLTGSTHMPFDYEKHSDDWKSPDGDAVREYTESMYYSDKHLGSFFDVAKTKTWYANTLFVIIADHSRQSIKMRAKEDPEYYHIPLLLTGGALKEEWRGKKWNKIISELDIPSTLLHQLQLPSEKYFFSRNFLNLSLPSSTYYVFFDGCGYLTDKGYATASVLNPEHSVSNITDVGLQTLYTQKVASYQQLIFELAKDAYKMKSFSTNP